MKSKFVLLYLTNPHGGGICSTGRYGIIKLLYISKDEIKIRLTYCEWNSEVGAVYRSRPETINLAGAGAKKKGPALTPSEVYIT